MRDLTRSRAQGGREARSVRARPVAGLANEPGLLNPFCSEDSPRARKGFTVVDTATLLLMLQKFKCAVRAVCDVGGRQFYLF
jgi:hypothetical protein